jgi:hypothetical protein
MLKTLLIVIIGILALFGFYILISILLGDKIYIPLFGTFRKIPNMIDINNVHPAFL